jgi:hypothetical protein
MTAEEVLRSYCKVLIEDSGLITEIDRNPDGMSDTHYAMYFRRHDRHVTIYVDVYLMDQTVHIKGFPSGESGSDYIIPLADPDGIQLVPKLVYELFRTHTF